MWCGRALDLHRFRTRRKRRTEGHPKTKDPNPFNPTTRINYDVPEMGHTDIRLYDLMGREVRTLLNRELAAGYHTINWDGKNNRGQIVSAGIYFCQLRARGFTKTLKMMLLK